MGIFTAAEYTYRFKYSNLTPEQAIGLVIPTFNKLEWSLYDMDINENPSDTVLISKTKFSWKSFGEFIIITIEDSNSISVKSISEYVGIDWGKNRQNCYNFEKCFKSEAKNHTSNELELVHFCFKEACENSDMIEV